MIKVTAAMCHDLEHTNRAFEGLTDLGLARFEMPGKVPRRSNFYNLLAPTLRWQVEESNLAILKKVRILAKDLNPSKRH